MFPIEELVSSYTTAAGEAFWGKVWRIPVSQRARRLKPGSQTNLSSVLAEVSRIKALVSRKAASLPAFLTFLNHRLHEPVLANLRPRPAEVLVQELVPIRRLFFGKLERPGCNQATLTLRQPRSVVRSDSGNGLIPVFHNDLFSLAHPLKVATQAVLLGQQCSPSSWLYCQCKTAIRTPSQFPFPLFSIFAQVSRSGTVRLKTSASGVASGSTQK